MKLIPSETCIYGTAYGRLFEKPFSMRNLIPGRQIRSSNPNATATILAVIVIIILVIVAGPA
jgi:hypothetical protein